jgi:Ethanolamine utilization protein EutJ (predicted chaperonin)
MHCLVALLLALQSATVVDVQGNHEVTLAVQVGDVIYTAEFSRHALKPESLIEGDHIAVEVRDGKMKIKRKDGKTVSGHVSWEQRVLSIRTREPWTVPPSSNWFL